MNLNLDDEQTAALVKLLADTIERDPFPMSPRVTMLRAILGKLGAGSAPAMPMRPPLRGGPTQKRRGRR